MRNVERLAKHIAATNAENILIHTVPGTGNWLICQKIEPDKWTITIGNPMSNATYNIGMVNDAQHLELWEQLTQYKIDTIKGQRAINKEVRQMVKNFLANPQTYNYLNKNEKTKKKTEPNRAQLCKELERLKDSIGNRTH